jgi:hypothetical protein
MRELQISRGLVALVDDEDYDRARSAGSWTAVPHGYTTYAQRQARRAGGTRVTQKLHSFITGWPYADHRNGDGLDNQRSNLRPATHGQNMGNKRRYSNNTSGFKGVSWHAQSQRWRVVIGGHGMHRSLGLFATPEEAARAYDAAAIEVFGEFARPSFPEAGRPGWLPCGGHLEALIRDIS